MKMFRVTVIRAEGISHEYTFTDSDVAFELYWTARHGGFKASLTIVDAP